MFPGLIKFFLAVSHNLLVITLVFMLISIVLSMSENSTNRHTNNSLIVSLGLIYLFISVSLLTVIFAIMAYIYFSTAAI